jgi:hypothetical protein
VAVLRVHGGEVLLEGVPAEGLEGAQAGVQLQAAQVAMAWAAGVDLLAWSGRAECRFITECNGAAVQMVGFSPFGKTVI